MGNNNNNKNFNNKSNGNNNGGNQRSAVDAFFQDFKMSKSGSLEAYINVNKITDFRVRGRYMSLIKDIAQGRIDFYDPRFIELMSIPQLRNNLVEIINERSAYYFWITQSMEANRNMMEKSGNPIPVEFSNAYTDMMYRRRAFETFSILFYNGYIVTGDPTGLMSIPIQMNNRTNRYEGKVLLSKFLI